MFTLAMDSKLRGCDLVKKRVDDVADSDHVLSRATVVRQRASHPVRFELTEQTRDAVRAWIDSQHLAPGDYRFPGHDGASSHLATRQYARIAKGVIALIGLDPEVYATHALRRTKNLRAVQLLLGHHKLESVVRYLGIEVDVLRPQSGGPGTHGHRRGGERGQGPTGPPSTVSEG